jgi:FKBP-type peptidyl-prolyl cis-trans isomerase SlyD
MQVFGKSATAVLAAASLTVACAAWSWGADKKSGAASGAETAANGKQVSVEYTLTLEDNSKIDSNVGKEPLVFVLGDHQIIPGLEKQLVGMKTGENKHIEVTPEEGYGPVDPQRKQEVDKTKIPEEARKIGAKLTGQTPDGRPVFAQVAEVKDNTVVLDLNHPLAGKKLFFDVKMLKVEDAPKKTEKLEGLPEAATPSAAKPAK